MGNYGFKCPNCGCTRYTEYNDKLRNGAVAGAVGAILLGPVGLLAAGFGADDSNTGRKCSNCGKKFSNSISDQQKQARNNAAMGFVQIGQQQFEDGYYSAMEDDYDDDDYDYDDYDDYDDDDYDY